VAGEAAVDPPAARDLAQEPVGKKRRAGYVDPAFLKRYAEFTSRAPEVSATAWRDGVVFVGAFSYGMSYTAAPAVTPDFETT
jgi:hypothetical protein